MQIDRYLVRRFLETFLILFGLLYILASAIDVVLQLDEFTEAARDLAGEDAGPAATAWMLIEIVVNYHGPRMFQFFAYLLGLVSVGAVGFTLAQMHRHRELVALLSSGMSLHRVAWPMIVTAFALNMVQLLNSNFVLPQLAPLLLRGHNDLGQSGIGSFDLPLTADSNGDLFQAAEFDPTSNELHQMTILQLDDQGKMFRHISAQRGTWDEAEHLWRLEGGKALKLLSTDAERGGPVYESSTIDAFPTDLSPQAITMNRYRQYAMMLSTRQIQEMIDADVPVDVDALSRIKYRRFSVIFCNLLLLMISIPFFLLREPANLLRQSVRCSIVTLPLALLVFILMEIRLEGIAAAVSVFLPAVLLFPLAMASISFIKT